ncbi:MAG: hypothetical protein CMJ47_02150 [Planctomyces sp.]|nr:hypothetical protein [Planctomyces sp.]
MLSRAAASVPDRPAHRRARCVCAGALPEDDGAPLGCSASAAGQQGVAGRGLLEVDEADAPQTGGAVGLHDEQRARSPAQRWQRQSV